MVKFNALVLESHDYDYVDPHLSGKVKRFRINNPGENSTFAAGLGKWGLLNLRGEVVIPAIYDEIWPFKEGLALSKKQEKYGYLDDTGAIAIPFVYDHAEDFTNGYAEVSKQGKYFYIDYMNEKTTLEEMKYKKLKIKPTKVVPLASESIPWHTRKNGNSEFIRILGEDDTPTKFKTRVAANDEDKTTEEDNTIKNLLQFLGTYERFKENATSPHLTLLDGTLKGLQVIRMNRNVKMMEINIGKFIEGKPTIDTLGLTKGEDPKKSNPARNYCLQLAKQLGIDKESTSIDEAKKRVENKLYFVKESKLYISNEEIPVSKKNNWQKETVGDYIVVRTTDSIIIKTPSTRA